MCDTDVNSIDWLAKNRFRGYPKTTKDLHRCWLDWAENNQHKLRFGQWMYNNYINDGEPFTELFYCDDNNKAYEMCMIMITG